MARERRLLGVSIPDRYHAVAAEMFELFKTSWELARDDTEYEVMLRHCSSDEREGRCLTIVTGPASDPAPATSLDDTPPRHPREGRDASEVRSASNRMAPRIRGTDREGVEVLGIALDLQCPASLLENNRAYSWDGSHRLQLSYDLFAEIDELLTNGQSGDAALNANLERHLEVLRVAMLTAGVPVVEIDPAPAGATFTVALTHDVDFARLGNHRCDRTTAGFLYRATVGTIVDFVRGRASASKLRRNLTAACALPLVHLGWAKDPWDCFAAYARLDRQWRSTFYVIPRRDHPGRRAPTGTSDAGRTCRYQASEVSADLQALAAMGFEIGLHGIDAWSGSDDASTERDDIQHASGTRVAGVRMHWLYFSRQTYAALEAAGFDYDSTFGFNDGIGFRAGTGQPFRPLGCDRLLELPPIIQDTALFFPRRMHLDETAALSVCARIIDEARIFGGGMTLLTHMRSIAPERCWDGFYTRLLGSLVEAGAWIAPAIDLIDFYRQRRRVVVQETVVNGSLRIQACVPDGAIDRRLLLRVRLPDAMRTVRHHGLEDPIDLAMPS